MRVGIMIGYDINENDTLTADFNLRMKMVTIMQAIYCFTRIILESLYSFSEYCNFR